MRKTGEHSLCLLRPCVWLRVWLPYRNAVYTVNGTMKLVRGECLQLSFQVPLVRAEVARMELTPDTLLLVDRMDKRYARLSVEEQRRLFGKSTDFHSVEALLVRASATRGKAYVEVSDLGIPMLDKGNVELSDFTDGPLRMSPTRLSSRYDRVEALELLDYLIKLSQ